MEKHNRPWLEINKWKKSGILRHLSPPARTIFLDLGDRLDRQSWECWPTAVDVTKPLGFPREIYYPAMDEIEAAGIFDPVGQERTKKKDAPGAWRYRLNPFDQDQADKFMRDTPEWKTRHRGDLSRIPPDKRGRKIAVPKLGTPKRPSEAVPKPGTPITPHSCADSGKIAVPNLGTPSTSTKYIMGPRGLSAPADGGPDGPAKPPLAFTQGIRSHSLTARGRRGALGDLVSFFTLTPPHEWDRHTIDLQSQGFKLTLIEEAKAVVAALPHQRGEGGVDPSPPPLPQYDLDRLERQFRVTIWGAIPVENRFIAVGVWPWDLEEWAKAEGLPGEVVEELERRCRFLTKRRGQPRTPEGTLLPPHDRIKPP